MDNTLLQLIITILALGIALNLWLTLGLKRAMHALMAAAEQAFTPPLGVELTSVTGTSLGSRERQQIPAQNQATVLLFLSSTCPKCREKLAEVERLLPLLPIAGVHLRLVSQESAWRLRRFLRGTGLNDLTLRVSKRDYRELNPTQTSPYYLFADHQTQLQAGGLIGDENWLSFNEQMAEIAMNAGLAW